MIYRFKGEIVEGGQRLFISIPFNVWEKCGQKGSIPVKVAIDNFKYECKLLPKGKGLYHIPIKKSDLKNISMNNEHEVSFELISELSRINNNSPYSLEKPVRKIDNIEIVNPSSHGVCGQACISMLSGVPLNEIINLMGSQCSISKVIEALNYFGIAHSDKMVYRIKQGGKLPKCCIINTKGHLMVFYDGKYYDPGKGILEVFDLNEITSFLEILI